MTVQARVSARARAGGRIRSSVVLGSLALIATACGLGIDRSHTASLVTEVPTSDVTGSPGSTTSANGPSATLTWRSCGKSLECADLTVPLDYAQPSGTTITLAVERHRASGGSKRIGSLLVNPGGPGDAGTELARLAEQVYSPTLLQRFDIVAWDPRGTGASSPVHCVDNLDPYYASDPTPDDDAEKQAALALSKQWADACRDKAGIDLLAHISTQDTAQDMDRIRAALGEEKISYFGFSYGSELGATFATMFPDRLRATVLDGSVDPNEGVVDQFVDGARHSDEILNRILSDCSNDKSCPFRNGGDASGAFDRLMAKLDQSPVTARSAAKGRPPVNQGVATMAVIQALYSPTVWPLLTRALADAQNGDGSGLLSLYDDYLRRRPDGTFEDTIQGLFAIECLDHPGPGSVAEIDASVVRLRAAGPRTGDAFAYFDPCLYWPVKPAPALNLTGKGAGPILVVGATGDPITPLEQTTAMAKAMERGVLLVREGDGHTSYSSGNACIDAAVDHYLVDLVAPADGTRCRA